MRASRLIMGMPITVELVDSGASEGAIEQVFALLEAVDHRFSTYLPESEISRLNRGEISRGSISYEMREVFELAEKTRQETGGYFDMHRPDGQLDPSGIVKGWALLNAANLVDRLGYHNFFIDGSGDIASRGHNALGETWSVGIRNPLSPGEIIKVLYPRGRGVATSGSYLRGAHIYNPLAPELPLDDVVSITVIGPDVLEADRFATAAFAMGRAGIHFIEELPNFEGYAIDAKGIAIMTSGLEGYRSPQ